MFSKLAAAGLLLCGMAAPAAAATLKVEGDYDHGRQLALPCQGCHGVPDYRNPYPRFRVPRIAGQPAAYLVRALEDYRQGRRRHATMQAQARDFSDQDIADLAVYLSAQ